MILKTLAAEWLQRNKKLRYSLVALLSVVLIGVVAYDRLATHERIAAEKTVDCPALHLGCQVEIRHVPYRITTDRPIGSGVPFVLRAEGGMGELRAIWKAPGVTVAANSARLVHESGDRWQATMTLPAAPAAQRDWVLHIEINARAVNIRTLAS